MNLADFTWKDFHELLPAAGTFSKDPRAWGLRDRESKGLISHGLGPMVVDSRGNAYLDWVSGLGANLFGHASRAWLSFWVTRIVAAGGITCASLPHEYELLLAEKLNRISWFFIKGASNWRDVQVRFGKTGSDALDMAVRLARAVTQKQVVIFTGYHGWHDWTIGAQQPAWGIPRQPARKMNLARIREWEPFMNIAAVVVEIPPGYDPSEFTLVREYCDQAKALLILDEVVTGFRYGRPGYVERLPAKPDIICFGKALGNGLPISAVIGPKDVMSWFARTDPVCCSSTSFGDVISLAGGLATLDALSEWDVPGHIRRVGELLIRTLSEVGEPYDFFRIEGDPERSLCVFERDEQRSLFIRWMMDKHIMINRPNFPTFAHGPLDVHITGKAAAEVLEAIATLDEEELKDLGNRYHARILFRDR